MYYLYLSLSQSISLSGGFGETLGNFTCSISISIYLSLSLSLSLLSIYLSLSLSLSLPFCHFITISFLLSQHSRTPIIFTYFITPLTISDIQSVLKSYTLILLIVTYSLRYECIFCQHLLKSYRFLTTWRKVVDFINVNLA